MYEGWITGCFLGSQKADSSAPKGIRNDKIAGARNGKGLRPSRKEGRIRNLVPGTGIEPVRPVKDPGF